MEKLTSPFASGLYITQGNHSTLIVDGKPMNKMAFDFANGVLVAPYNCSITRVYRVSPTYNSYFFINLPDGSQILVGHAIPVRTGNFKQGEVICNSAITPNPTGSHYHMAIIVNKQWGCLMDYIDRHTIIKGRFPYGNWWKYRDLYLNLGKDYIAYVTAIPNLRNRSQPNTKSTVIGLIPYNSKVIVRNSAIGESVRGDSKWWKYGDGYIPNSYLKMA